MPEATEIAEAVESATDGPFSHRLAVVLISATAGFIASTFVRQGVEAVLVARRMKSAAPAEDNTNED